MRTAATVEPTAPAPRAPVAGRQMLRMTDLTRMFGVDQSTIYRWEKREGFPPRVHMGSNSVAWPLDEVEAWSAMRPRGPKSGKSATA